MMASPHMFPVSFVDPRKVRYRRPAAHRGGFGRQRVPVLVGPVRRSTFVPDEGRCGIAVALTNRQGPLPARVLAEESRRLLAARRAP